MRRLTYEEAARMPRGAKAPRFSPDGLLLAYCQDGDIQVYSLRAGTVVGRLEGRSPAWSPDCGVLAFERDGSVWVAQPHGNAPRELGPGTGPVWSAVGDLWCRRGSETGTVSIWRGQPAPLCGLQEVVTSAHPAFSLSPDGRWLAHFGAEPSPEVLPGLPEWAIWVGSRPAVLELRALDLVAGRCVSGGRFAPGCEPSHIAWRPDSLVVACSYDLNAAWSTPEPLDRRVCIWEPGGQARMDFAAHVASSVSRASWSPDGRQMAMLANPWGRYTTDPFGWVTVCDVPSEQVVWQNRQTPGTTAPLWSPDGQAVYCRVLAGTDQPYAAFKADGTEMARLTPPGHYCAGASLSPDGSRLAVSAREFSGTNRIWLCPTDGGQPVCVAPIPDPPQLDGLGQVRTHEWTVGDGVRLEGLVVEPPPDLAAEAPLLVWLTGGPERGWNICDLEANTGFLVHAIAQRGYRVFIPDHRRTGRSGLQYVAQQWHPQDAANDVAAGVRSLRERRGGGCRTVAFGHSDGGDMLCAMMVAYPDLFAAAVASGISPDLGSLYGIEGSSNPILFQSFGGSPWGVPEAYVRASVIIDAPKIRTPLLILMGGGDTSCPLAENLYAAMREAGGDVAFLRFEDQGHWPEEPGRVASYVATAVRWLDKRLGRTPSP
jgi:dipeptidyl aminopeptidase/acylaminoacyl peptidase